MIRAIRCWRLEGLKDALDRAEAKLAKAHRFDDAFGGRRGDIRHYERVVARLERRIAKLENKLAIDAEVVEEFDEGQR